MTRRGGVRFAIGLGGAPIVRMPVFRAIRAPVGLGPDVKNRKLKGSRRRIEIGHFEAPIGPVIGLPNLRANCAIRRTAGLDDHGTDRQRTPFGKPKVVLHCTPADCGINRTPASGIALPCPLINVVRGVSEIA